MGSLNDPAIRQPDWFRLRSEDFNGAGFGRLILMVLVRLDSVFPDRVDLSQCKTISEYEHVFTKLWTWLSEDELGVVSGPISNASLTLLGRQSLRAALKNDPQLAALTQSEKDKIDDQAADRAIYQILRQHFEAFKSNSGQNTAP